MVYGCMLGSPLQMINSIKKKIRMKDFIILCADAIMM